MQELLFLAFLKTTSQLAGLFGVFFLYGMILSKFQTWTHRQYARSIGWRGILWTAWIGTPVHELGHALLAILFRHRVHRISLFAPNPATGNLGSVDHSFNPKSLYQRIGNFFIGAAPLFFGSAILTILLVLLVPNSQAILAPTAYNGSFAALWASINRTLMILFDPGNIRQWNFWLFLYISLCIASHVAPSKADRRAIWSGLFWIAALLFCLNLLSLGLQKPGLTAWLEQLNQFFGVLFAMFFYTSILSALHFLFVSILFFPFTARRKE